MKRKIIISISILFVIITIALATKFAIDLKTKDIPKVYFEGDISNMKTKADEREILLKYRSSKLNFDKYTKIKIQGTSSLSYEKKNYTINLYKDNSYEEKQKVDVGFGWDAQSKYCLKANWIDKTHARNIVSARIAGKVQEKFGIFENTPHNGTIDGFPVEIYINGEFLGLYTWNIPKDEWMWNMDKENPNHIVIGGGEWTDSTFMKKEITTFSESGWDVEVGKENDDTKNKFNRLINFVNNSSDEEFKKDFELYLDKDSSINYVVLLYVMQAVDNNVKNTMFATYDGKVWYPTLYDLDTTFGTYFDGTLMDSYVVDSVNKEHRLWSRILECFPKEVADRYFGLRKDILTNKNILKEFNNFIDDIPEETYKKESERWKEIPGFNINQIEEFLSIRMQYVDILMTDIKNRNN